MRISDWSSDVCSSDLTVDLEDAGANKAMTFCVDAGTLQSIATKLPAEGVATIESDGNTGISIKRSEERRVGKSVSVRVDLGGRRIIKKKQNYRRRTTQTHNNE